MVGLRPHYLNFNNGLIMAIKVKASHKYGTIFFKTTLYKNGDVFTIQDDEFDETRMELVEGQKIEKVEAKEIELDETVDFSSMTKPEIMRYAKQQGVKFEVAQKKQDIIDLIEAKANGIG